MLEAGGKILSLWYAGGFLFEVPCMSDSPIETGDKTEGGGTIVVEPFDQVQMEDNWIRRLPRQETALESPISTISVNKRKRNRLQKRRQQPQESEDPIAFRDDLFMMRDQRRLTIVELLLEEAGHRRATIEATGQSSDTLPSDDNDWETLHEEDASSVQSEVFWRVA